MINGKEHEKTDVDPEKSFIASLMKVFVYVTSNLPGDMTLEGLKSRKSRGTELWQAGDLRNPGRGSLSLRCLRQTASRYVPLQEVHSAGNGGCDALYEAETQSDSGEPFLD